MEEGIENVPEIKALNPTSFNTCRIVTVSSPRIFKVVVAALRVGAKDLGYGVKHLAWFQKYILLHGMLQLFLKGLL